MSKLENSQVVRVLQDNELHLVIGGVHEVDGGPSLNPLDIYGFNPQPDPPGASLGR
jgi:hypothetical protein